jgi:hypothetical protein
MKLFYKILFIFWGKGLFSLPLHNPGRITSILTHINAFISELVFHLGSLGERCDEFRMRTAQDIASVYPKTTNLDLVQSMYDLIKLFSL